MMPILEVIGLTVDLSTRRGVVHAVDDVSFNVGERETLAIVGESGSGKSVTSRSIVGLLPKRIVRRQSGVVRFLGEDLVTASENRLTSVRGRDIGMVFQDPMTSLNPVLKVGSQVAEPLRRHLGMSRSEAHARAVELLEEVRIPNASQRVNSYPHEFSGGMRQRALIAAATGCRPKLLIADEPTTALDVTVQAEILELLKGLQSQHGMALILVSHDLNVVSNVADRVAVMYAGQVVEYASCEDLFARPEHPYTEGLLGSIPSIASSHAIVRSQRLTAIPGSPPNPADLLAACRFAERCQYATPGSACLSAMPSLREIRPDHWVRSSHPRDRTLVERLRWPDSVEPMTGDSRKQLAGEQSSEQGDGMEDILVVKGLSKRFPAPRRVGRSMNVKPAPIKAVDNVSFSLAQGETLGFVGESGSGKSTTAYCVLQLLAPTAGSITFLGVDLVNCHRSELKDVRREMQIVFQDPYSSLDPRMSIASIIAEPLVVHRVGDRYSRRERVRRLLEMVGMSPDIAHRSPGEFSGGQRQRVAIARALALNPKVVICDEPTSSVDVSVQAQIINLLKDLQDELGLSYLFISHDLSIVYTMSDRIAVMQRGSIVEIGAAEQVFREPVHDYTRTLLSSVPSR